MRIVLAALFAASSLVYGAGAEQCYATFNGSELKIGNTRVERVWRFTKGGLYPVSFRLKSGAEWLSGPPDSTAPSNGTPAAETPKLAVRRGRGTPVEEESLTADLTAGSAHYRFQIYPGADGLSVQVLAGGGPAVATGEQVKASGIETAAAAKGGLKGDVAEALALIPQHLRVIQVNLADQTDIHNELVQEREWLLHSNEKIQVAGNLLIVENTFTHEGLILLKEAPLPHARPVKRDVDFEIDPNRRRVAALGTERVTTLAYTGGLGGRVVTLQNYQRQLRIFDPSRDGMFLSNTWGDRSRDARINTEFLTKEIEAGARLGVDVIQVDDGWQQGRSANSVNAGGVWNGFWAADPHFWNANATRFPGGLKPLVEAAKARGMRFGLWFAPDSSNDFANWEKDAAQLLTYWKNEGVRYYKIDGVKSTTTLGEERLHKMFERILTESKGEIAFDLDVTAEIRPGYFGSMSTGPLFVENRYTDLHRYWPHQTLRNLWELAHYVDPLRLRIEFLNNARNGNLYPNDPLAPSKFSPDYLFATTMFANPLGWFEISNLGPEYFARVSPLVAVWKKNREAIHRGNIVPLGSAPDGTSWTGFASVAQDRKSAQLLVFREENSTADWIVDVPLLLQGSYKVSVLGGSGAATVNQTTVKVKIPEPRSYVWLIIEP